MSYHHPYHPYGIDSPTRVPSVQMLVQPPTPDARFNPEPLQQPHPTPLPRPLPPHPTTAGMTVGQLDAWIRGQFHSNSFNSFNG